MLTKKELEQAIQECENLPVNLTNCDKLATFYTIYDHRYPQELAIQKQEAEELTVGSYGGSDFLKRIEGTKAEEAWQKVDELIETLKVVNPRLYESFMRRL